MKFSASGDSPDGTRRARGSALKGISIHGAAEGCVVDTPAPWSAVSPSSRYPGHIVHQTPSKAATAPEVVKTHLGRLCIDAISGA